jgi:hypothetical protein
MRKGRLPSLFLLSTIPISGIWFPSRASDQANRARRFEWIGNELCWYPAKPDGGDKKKDFVLKLVKYVEDYRARSPASFLKLSGTSKTGVTWSLPALGSCPVTDETCNNCYALDGFYRTNAIAQVGRVMRYEYLKDLIRDDNMEEWVIWISNKINKLRSNEAVPETTSIDKNLKDTMNLSSKSQKYIRWHDSGDVFHIEYLKSIFEVCRRTNKTLHWLPTRMARLVYEAIAVGEHVPINLAIQVSCHKNGKIEKSQLSFVQKIRELQPSARIGVTYDLMGLHSRKVTDEEVSMAFGDLASLCPATIASNSDDRVCVGCRKCWSATDPDSPIVYAIHRGN